MDIFIRSFDAQQDWPIGAASARDEDDQRQETEEPRDEVFEATLLWLDQKAAERLTALAGL